MKRIQAMLKDPVRARWLFYGDSLTHGAKHTCGMRDFTEYFRERVVWELHRSQDLVLNSAHSGFKTSNLLNDFEWRAAAFRPTAAFVMIGTNDARVITPEEFARQLEELMDRFAAISTQVILQTPIPVLNDMVDSEKTLPLLAEVMRQTAKHRNIPLIDHFELWSHEPAAFYLHADALHPNGHGHIKIAHDIFRALGIFETEKSWVCRLFAPDAL